MAHVLVTGASGFIGLALTRALAARGDRVTGLDRLIAPGLAEAVSQYENVAACVCEMTEWQVLVEALKDDPPDAAIHCAAVVGVLASAQAPLTTMRVNVEGSLNLFEAARLFGVPRIIHMSSEETYGSFQAPAIDETHPQNPVMAYGVSKLAVEHLGRSYRAMYGTEVINLRTCWVYGPSLPRLRVPRLFTDAAAGGTSCHLPWGADMRVDHTYIDDLIDGILLALDLPAHPYDAYNMGTGQAPSLAEMVDVVREIVPAADISVGTGEYRHGLPGSTAVAVNKGALIIDRARDVLGYSPRFDIRKGLAACIEAKRAEAQ
jgi:nucleoside-diphosphate-sugar epimerase